MHGDADLTALVHALGQAGVTEVDTSTLGRALHASDASLYRVVPQAVVSPRDADEVLAVLAVCRQLRVPLTSRGAGTSIAGNAVGPGVVLDLAKHLSQVRSVDVDAREAVVQPGVVLDTLQAAAGAHGLRFGPDPSTHDRCTLGGMVGNNACGSRALAYGRTSDNVLGLDVVTGSGERLQLRSGAAPPSSPALEQLQHVVADALAPIRTELGRFGRQGSGYALEHLLPERGFDVGRALVGSEGTLGVVVAATLRLVPEPGCRALVVLGYPDMAAAADAAPGLLAHRPRACEGLDARIVDAVRRQRGGAAVPPLPDGAGWLVLEVAGDSLAEVGDRAGRIVADAAAVDASVVSEPAAMAQLWGIREDGAGLVARGVDGVRAHSGWEDAAVPPARLGAYLRDFDSLLDQHALTGIPYGHFGDGCVHVRITFPLDRPDGRIRFRGFLLDAARLVASYGGSMSGEHGDGRARSELLPLMYSTDVIDLFGRVKAALDPDGVLNPGVLVDPSPVDADLRASTSRPVRERLGLLHRRDGGDFSTAVHRCTGVGKCLADNTAHGAVMCPSYLATGREQDSTRGRARVLQEMVAGRLVAGGWRSPEVHQALDLCLSCKACSSDCPTGVDMAQYKAEVLHQTYRHRARPRSHYSLGALPRWARLAARAPSVANAVLSSPRAATLARWAAGVDQRRALPSFAPRTFRAWFAARGPGRPGGREVLLWPDTFTDVLDPEVGISAVQVLEAAGYRVTLPEQPACCGLTWLSTGQLDTARRRAAETVAALLPAVRRGVPVVGLEPSCTATLRADAPELLNGRSVDQVAVAVRTLAELLTQTPGWRPPALDGTSVLAQPHCHHSAVLGWDTDATLLRSTGADLKQVGGCCGLAGSFGMERGHYEVSVAVAEHDLLPAVRASAEGTVLLADGFSCRTQLADLAGAPAVHLSQLLASGISGRTTP